jgi:serine/threonine-protein kinase
MAPEQCAGAGKVDARADLYAVGCILFELLSGRPPFLGDGAGEVIGQHQYVPAPALRTLAPEASMAMEDLVARLLAKQPEQRLQQASDVLRALGTRSAVISTGSQSHVVVSSSGEIGHPQTTLGGSASQISSWPGVPPAPRRGRGGVIIGVAATAVVAAVVVIAIVAGTSGKTKDGAAGVAPAAQPPVVEERPAPVAAPAPAPVPVPEPEPPVVAAPAPAPVEPPPVEKPAVAKPTTTRKPRPEKPKPATTAPERPRTQVVEDL